MLSLQLALPLAQDLAHSLGPLDQVLVLFVPRAASKREILELYLKEIYLGPGVLQHQRIGEAARMYFHKDVGNLTLVESALLAGMIQSPSPYNPYRHPRRATERRNLVIRAMQDAGFIEEEAATAALPQPLRVEPATVDSAEAPTSSTS